MLALGSWNDVLYRVDTFIINSTIITNSSLSSSLSPAQLFAYVKDNFGNVINTLRSTLHANTMLQHSKQYQLRVERNNSFQTQAVSGDQGITTRASIRVF